MTESGTQASPDLPPALRALVARPALTWTMAGKNIRAMMVDSRWPQRMPVSLDWREATGRGIRVCILDSGIEGGHPMVGDIQGSYAVEEQPTGECEVVPAEPSDASGHGTACAGVIRAVAQEAELHSVRVLGDGLSGSGAALICGLRWAVDQRFDVINMSLSTTRRNLTDKLRVLADDAYFANTVIVSSAHNLPVESFPWRFSSVISVGSHDTGDAMQFFYNPSPPVEFFAHGVDVDVAWRGGSTRRCTGNSFATPHISGYCAQILSRHPELTAFQVKNLLYLTAANVRGTE
jgi:subtilisin family serine protease